ncbi:MAG: selenocysteine-specific translation elongation factor [Armatimonadota bacterium]
MRLKKAERINIMIGTAGHIDHGKTELTKLLTGCDTDRLQAEKERGMSLELGFAPWHTPDGRIVGIVDVPGHERFVRKMVAAATCIDLLLLVVAADDGVMPQTREHLEICTLLGLKRGLVALTKIDLVDELGRQLAMEDVAELLAGTFLEGAAVVPVSPISGEGFERFYQTLAELVADTPSRQTSGVFRMPVERRFVQKGVGTVVTGIPQAGSVSVDDTVELLPLGRTGRVRGLQVYRMEDETALAGECVALNVPDLDHKLIERGQVLAAPGYFSASTRVTGRLRLLPTAKPLANRATVRFHTGMVEALGRAVLLERDLLAPGDDCLAQFILEQPVVAWTGDPFVVRLHSPVVTVGGGVVIDCQPRKLRRYQKPMLEGLRQCDRALTENRLLEHELLRADSVPVSRQALARTMKLPPDELGAALEPLVAAGKVAEIGHRRDLCHVERLAPVRRSVLSLLADFHERQPLRLGMSRAEVEGELDVPEEVVGHLLTSLEAEGEIVREGRLCRLASHELELSAGQQQLLDRLERLYEGAGFATPSPAEAAQRVGSAESEAESAAALLCDRGILVEVEPGIVFHQQAVEKAKELLVEHIEQEGPLPSPTFRDLLGVTRKHAIPLLDYFDRIGLTTRVGNTRVLAPGRDRADAS